MVNSPTLEKRIAMHPKMEVGGPIKIVERRTKKKIHSYLSNYVSHKIVFYDCKLFKARFDFTLI